MSTGQATLGLMGRLPAAGDGCVRAWQTCSGGQLLETVEVGCLDQMASCTALAKDETEQQIAVGLSNGTLSIWKLSAQSQPAPFCQLDLVRQAFPHISINIS